MIAPYETVVTMYYNPITEEFLPEFDLTNRNLGEEQEVVANGCKCLKLGNFYRVYDRKKFDSDLYEIDFSKKPELVPNRNGIGAMWSYCYKEKDVTTYANDLSNAIVELGETTIEHDEAAVDLASYIAELEQRIIELEKRNG